ncbi:phosphatase PAP2 family protein [Tsuneonella sp. HG222]
MTATKTAAKAKRKLLDADDKARKASLRHRGGASGKVFDVLGEAGDQPQLRLLSGGILVAGLFRRDPRMIAAGTRMLLSHELATVAKNFVKRRVDRDRPHAATGKDGHKPSKGRHTSHDKTSFPSGHSAGSLAVASALGAVYPEHRGKALAAAGAVALAQIPRCKHYPTDVGAGLAIGKVSDLAIGALAALLFAGWRRRREG